MKHLFLATLLFILPSFAAASPIMYECDMTDKRQKLDWVADKIVIVVNDDGSVIVVDDVILHFNDNKPMQARVGSKTKNKLKLRWAIKNARDSQNVLVQFNYSSNLNLKTLKIVVYADPASFSQRWSGRGSCKIHTDAKALKSLRLR